MTHRCDGNGDSSDEKLVRRYGDAELPLTISGEVVDVVLSVPEVAPKKAATE